MAKNEIVLLEEIEPRILIIRGQKVMLDADLAFLYGVSTKRLNEQVKRNRKRFPSNFLFQRTAQEKAEAVANCDHLAKLKYSPILPYAFTEHGAIMAASVLNSPRAIEVSVLVVRTFVKLREMLATHKELAHKLADLETKVAGHDEAIRSLVVAIDQLMAPPPDTNRRKIGFGRDNENRRYHVHTFTSHIRLFRARYRCRNRNRLFRPAG